MGLDLPPSGGSQHAPANSQAMSFFFRSDEPFPPTRIPESSQPMAHSGAVFFSAAGDEGRWTLEVARDLIAGRRAVCRGGVGPEPLVGPVAARGSIGRGGIYPQLEKSSSFVPLPAARLVRAALTRSRKRGSFSSR